LAVCFDQIKIDFAELRDFFLNDLERIVSQEIGGNYAVAALVMMAHEEIARVRYAKKNAGHESFSLTLPKQWQPVASSLYDALRNGLVHGYRAQTILLDSLSVEIAVSWREHDHLTTNGARVYLNAEQLSSDLRKTFDEYEAELRDQAGQRDRFLTQRRKASAWTVRNPAEAKAWQRLLGGA
jgi:hypothetical protein